MTGHILLCDFGNSRDLEDKFRTATTTTAGGLLAGTQAYLPPEAWVPQQWKRCPTAIDMWAVGIMLAELFAGMLYSWNIQQNTVATVQGDELFGANVEAERRDGHGWDVVRQLLAKSPADRPTAHTVLLLPYFNNDGAVAVVGRAGSGGVHFSAGEAKKSGVAAAYTALHRHLSSVRADASKMPSFEMAVKCADTHQLVDFCAGIDFDNALLAQTWRIEVEHTFRPFSEVAQACVMHFIASTHSDPHKTLVEDAKESTAGEGRNEVQPLAAAANLGSRWALPIPGLGERDDQSIWRGFGRLLAKCVLENVPLRLPFPPSFYQILCQGTDAAKPEIAELDAFHPEISATFRAVLEQRHGKGSSTSEVTTATYPGFTIAGGSRAASATIISDTNKRAVVKAWVRHALIENRRSLYDALHDGFVNAFDWRENLAILAERSDHLGFLLCSNGVLNRDDVAEALQLVACVSAGAGAGEGAAKSQEQQLAWLKEFIEESPLLVVQQFIVRATGSFFLDHESGAETAIMVITDSGIKSVTFTPDSRFIMLPECATKELLHFKLSRTLNVAESKTFECCVCSENFPKTDGLHCSSVEHGGDGGGGGGGGGGGAPAAPAAAPAAAPPAAPPAAQAAAPPPRNIDGEDRHFYCRDCLAGLVEAACRESAERLTSDQRAGLVCCSYCKTEITEEQLHQMLSVENRKLYRSTEKRKIEHTSTKEAETKAKVIIENELQRLALMSEEERATDKHRTHIVQELLTLHCPRCKIAILNYDGCAAIVCESKDHHSNVVGCGCGFCAICFEDCGEDAHSHIESEHVDFPNLNDGFFLTEVVVQEHWKQMKIRKVLAYLHGIGDASERERAYIACVQDFVDLEMEIRL